MSRLLAPLAMSILVVASASFTVAEAAEKPASFTAKIVVFEIMVGGTPAEIAKVPIDYRAGTTRNVALVGHNGKQIDCSIANDGRKNPNLHKFGFKVTELDEKGQEVMLTTPVIMVGTGQPGTMGCKDATGAGFKFQLVVNPTK